MSVNNDSNQAAAKPGLFRRFFRGFGATREYLQNDLQTILANKTLLDDEDIEALEDLLISADIGYKTANHLIVQTQHIQYKRNIGAFDALKEAMRKMLLPLQAPLEVPRQLDVPFIIMVVGINGAGKTTTIGKLANRLKREKHSVLLAAGDTFRAAAVEQLSIWGERNDVEVIAQKSGGDSAAVIYEAIQKARKKKTNILLADTAGRLHTQDNLMRELEKIKRVIQQQDSKAPHEILLVLDGTLGQNSLLQLKEFNQYLNISGLIITKLDGTTKGGVLFSLAHEYDIPVRFVGIGEGIEDLQPFNVDAFINAIFD